MPGQHSAFEEKKVREEEVQAPARKRELTTVTAAPGAPGVNSTIIASKNATIAPANTVSDPKNLKMTLLADDVVSVHLPSGSNGLKALPGAIAELKARVDLLAAQGKTLKIQGDFNINVIEKKFEGLDAIAKILAEAGLKIKSINLPGYVTNKKRGLPHINPQWLKANLTDLGVKDLCIELTVDNSPEATAQHEACVAGLKKRLTALRNKSFPFDVSTDHAMVGTLGANGWILSSNIIESKISKNDLYDPKDEARVSAASNALSNFQAKLIARKLMSEEQIQKLFADIRIEGVAPNKILDVIDINTESTYTSVTQVTKTVDGKEVKEDKVVQLTGVDLKKRLMDKGITPAWEAKGLYYNKKGEVKYTEEQFENTKQFALSFYNEVFASPEFAAYNNCLNADKRYDAKKIQTMLECNVTGGPLAAAVYEKDASKKVKEACAKAKIAGGDRSAYVVDFMDKPEKLINYFWSGAGTDPSTATNISPSAFVNALAFQANNGFPVQPYMTTKAIDIAQARHFFNMAKEMVGSDPIDVAHLIECTEESHTPMFYDLMKLIVDVSRTMPLSVVDFEAIQALYTDKDLFRPYCDGNVFGLDEEGLDAVNATAYYTRLEMMLNNETETNIQAVIATAIASVIQERAAARAKAEADALSLEVERIRVADAKAAAEERAARIAEGQAANGPAVRVHFSQAGVQAAGAQAPQGVAALNQGLNDEEALAAALRASQSFQ